MKRYNITIESGFNNQRRIKITSADNGEWVRYEDVAEALELKSNLYDAELHHSEYMRQQNRDLQERIDQLEAALKVYEDIVADSTGVDGYHLNGTIALWDEFELPQFASGPEQIPENYGGTNG